MATSGIDVIVSVKPQNIYYITGFRNMGYHMFQAAIIPREKDVTIVTRGFEKQNATHNTWIKNIRVYLDGEDPFDLLKDTLEAMNLADKRVGLEIDDWFLPVKSYEKLTKVLRRAQLKDASGIIDELRLVKSEEELSYVRRAGKLADMGVQSGIDAIRDGVHEYEVTAEMLHSLYKNGQDDAASNTYVIVLSDIKNFGHTTYREKKIREGDFVWLEVNGCCNLYAATVMRTVFLGNPPRRYTELYDAALKAHDEGIKAVRPGARPGDVHLAAQNVIDKAGFGGYQPIRYGLAIGICGYKLWTEPLSLIPEDPHILRPGMVISVGPGIAVDGIGVVGVGDNVIVKEDGYEYVTTHQPRKLIIK